MVFWLMHVDTLLFFVLMLLVMCLYLLVATFWSPFNSDGFLFGLGLGIVGQLVSVVPGQNFGLRSFAQENHPAPADEAAILQLRLRGWRSFLAAFSAAAFYWFLGNQTFWFYRHSFGRLRIPEDGNWVFFGFMGALVAPLICLRRRGLKVLGGALRNTVYFPLSRPVVDILVFSGRALLAIGALLVAGLGVAALIGYYLTMAGLCLVAIFVVLWFVGIVK